VSGPAARPLISSPDPGLWEWANARQRCLREARRILRNRDDAEEAVQEAFVRAWRKRNACRTPGAPLPWLLQITRNESMRLAARRSRRQASEIPEAEPEAAPSGPAVDAQLDQTLTSVATEQALSTLGEDERRLLRLRYEEDLTQGQVAAALGVPEGTVKVRLHRVRARLRGVAGDLAA
jgi:RNA polymerase sigma-70 factor (ECF subfamily)